MHLRLETGLVCIVIAILIQLSFCDENLSKSRKMSWGCSCSFAPQENTSFILANCSSSCECKQVAYEEGSYESSWFCNFSSGFPILASEENGYNSFTTCNFSYGNLSDLETPVKHIYNKTLVMILATCVVVLFLAFVVSFVLLVRIHHKNLVTSASHSSDFCSIGTNLMSHGGSSRTISSRHIDSSIKPFTGCIPKTSFLFKTNRETIHEVLIRYSYTELENATERFSDANLIGFGGSSHVYRGNLRDGRTVAIKKMKTQAGPDAEHVFLTEIELLSRLHHCHVVPLLGYCENKGRHAEKMLVFEYIPNGNLRECLDSEFDKFLEWKTRLMIALGAARGLEYLHEAAAPSILHRDVKSTNILLDEKWRAKISDLGMAKHLQTGANPSSCSNSPERMQGTFGYFAPEYAIGGRASLKSDVFSFGVVLLELITGRKPIQKNSDKTPESLVIWATPRLHDSKRVILELPDPNLKGKFEEEEMQVMAYLAKECLLLDPDSRPSMSEVVQILSTIATSKYKRSNLSLHSFHLHSVDDHVNYASDMEEIKKTTFEVRNKKSKEAIENENVELLSKNGGVVDLTEPWLESFHLPDVDSFLER